eukprot:CAMPEP_0175804552 /NCGR_PEP_ID=MMETSP0107_2-20121207/179_1 /TAXON_ID=195067 ORGANISM="Goniomonas pacifica, Strain CCMP1869" /NCGR_SAMPLE_ID=MMETSP0107_2 /ASSEMBLY_ACC=CAM_ASM_000203 /LENGTH=123 /DNA_ID=CAMNT_0017115905 /DNA_START=92 /DNA_END=463 /DNA_ORIENTATION=+
MPPILEGVGNVSQGRETNFTLGQRHAQVVFASNCLRNNGQVKRGKWKPVTSFICATRRSPAPFWQRNTEAFHGNPWSNRGVESRSIGSSAPANDASTTSNSNPNRGKDNSATSQCKVTASTHP